MAMVVGCDLVELDEIAGSLESFGDKYIRKVFTEAEAAYCVGPDRISRFAARFAAKEAVIKALKITSDATPFPEIEVVTDGTVPAIRLHGSIARIADQRRATGWTLSMSHATCHAMAVVVAIVDDAPAPD